MPLPLPYVIDDRSDVQGNFDAISLSWPSVGALQLVGTAVAFQNAWANFGGGFQACAYYRDGTRIYLQGLVTGGALGTAIFTLPVGYRPVATGVFAVDSGGGFGRVTVSAAGVVTPTIGAITSVSLDGISFRAA